MYLMACLGQAWPYGQPPVAPAPITVEETEAWCSQGHTMYIVGCVWDRTVSGMAMWSTPHCLRSLATVPPSPDPSQPPCPSPLALATQWPVVPFLVSSCSSERRFCKVQTGEWMSPDELTPGLVLSTAGVKLHALAMAGRLPVTHQPALLSPLPLLPAPCPLHPVSVA